MKTLIAGAGYRNLRDLSFGPELVDRLQTMDWPSDVQIEDFSYGPIAVYQWFLEHEGCFRRAIFAGSVVRGRGSGSLHYYPWRGSTDDEDAVQARIAEALTGVISLENLLVICEHFGVLPHEVSVIEIEPADEGWGPGLSDGVTVCLNEAIEILRCEVGVAAGSSE
ncbi:MAG: hypothetical protein ACR2PL_23470 [Dehalococcoidia bacterium]